MSLQFYICFQLEKVGKTKCQLPISKKKLANTFVLQHRLIDKVHFYGSRRQKNENRNYQAMSGTCYQKTRIATVVCSLFGVKAQINRTS